jgi:hypothetical protein
VCRSAALLSSVVSPERSEGTRSTIGGLCFLVFSSSAVRREATPVLRASARPIAISDPLSCVRCADAVVRASARHATPSVARRSTIVSTYFHAKATVCRYPGGGGGGVVDDS